MGDDRPGDSIRGVSRYLALLRGINVGGNNLIKMVALKACFEDNGFANVVTFIQSGNVLFDAAGVRQAALVLQVEKMLATTFSYPASVVLRSRKQLRDIVARAPEGFGKHPTRYRHDVLFLKEPLNPAVAVKSVLTREGVDQVWTGPGVLYFSRLESRATQSLLGRLVSSPIYKSLTIRNWNTTTKLALMMDTGT